MHVLLIEENLENVDLVRKCLADSPTWPCVLTHVGDLESGLVHCCQETVDVVLLDLSLPDSQGLDSVRSVKAVGAHLPLVVLISWNEEQLGLAAVHEGAQDYLVKEQLNAPELLRALRCALERERAQEELLEREKRQARKEHLHDGLAAGLAMDICSLMSVVIGYSELLLAGSLSQGEQKFVQEIMKAGNNAWMVIDRILTFCRRRPLQPSVLDLNALVADIEPKLRSLIGGDIEMSTFLDAAVLPINADPRQVEVVLENLVVHSCDAMPWGGKLTIETSTQNLSGSEWHEDFMSSSRAYARLAVKDSGCGMDKVTKARFFEPCLATRKEGTETGRGLATVHAIVTESGGHFAVYSRLGHGTTFEVYLPQVGENASALGSTIGSAERTPRRETVLLVMVEESVRRFARDILQANGYTVLDVSNGKDALEIGAQYRGSIHLLVSNTIMPGMDGRELRELLHAMRPPMGVVYVSNSTENVVVHDGGLDSGIVTVPKPLSPAVLLRQTREMLDAAKLAARGIG